MPDVSLIIPIYNSEAIVANTVEDLKAFVEGSPLSIEVIFVDDGSIDNSVGKSKEVAPSAFKFISLDRNQGKGAAVRTGMLEAQGDCCIFTDVDLPFDLSAVAYAASLVNDRAFHLVVGDRALSKSNYEALSGLRKVATQAFRTTVRLLVTGEVFDTQCGFKAFRKDVAKELFPLLRMKGFSFDAELIYIALKYNLEIRRIPVKARPSFHSSVRPVADGLSMLFDILGLPSAWRKGAYKSERLKDLGQFSYWS